MHARVPARVVVVVVNQSLYHCAYNTEKSEIIQNVRSEYAGLNVDRILLCFWLILLLYAMCARML